LGKKFDYKGGRMPHAAIQQSKNKFVFENTKGSERKGIKEEKNKEKKKRKRNIDRGGQTAKD